MALDPYELRHLVAHLELAGNTVELHRLLAARADDDRNLWFGLKDAHGDVDGYQRDIDRAQRVVRRAVDAELDAGRTTQEIGREIHYTLLAASVLDQVKNLPPELFAALVANGVWSPEAGLAAASGNLEAVTSLLPHLPPDLAERAVHDAMAAVSSLEDDWDRAKGLDQLAPFLTSQHADQVLDLLAGLPAGTRDFSVEHLAGSLPADRMHTVVNLIAESDNSLRKSKALAAIGPHVPDDVVGAVEAAANMIADPADRAVAMSGIADRLDIAVLRGLLTAMAATRENNHARTQALTLLRPSLSGELLTTAMAAADAATGLFRLEALTAIASALTPELAATVLRTALTADYRPDSDELIIALVPRLSMKDIAVVLRDARRRKSQEVLTAAALVLPPAKRDKVLGEAFNIVERRHERWSGAQGYFASAEHIREARVLAELPTRFLGRAVKLAEGMTPEMAVALADRLSRAGFDAEREHLLRTVLHAIRHVEDEHGSRARAMATLAPALSRSLRWEALTEAGTASEGWFYGEDWHGVFAVRMRVKELVPYLDADQLSVAMSMARELRDTAARSEALTSLLPYLTEPTRAAALERTLTLTYRIIDSYERRSRMAELAPVLPPRLFEQHLTVAGEIRNPEIRAAAIAMLSEHMPAELVQRAADLLTDNPYPGWTSLAYARLAFRSTGRQRQRLYERAVADFGAISSDEPGAADVQILRALLAAAPDELVPDLRAKADWISFSVDRARFLAELATRLDGPARTEALAAALATAHRVERIEYRAETLGALGEDVPGVRAAIGEIDDPVHHQVALAALGHPVSTEDVLRVERRWRPRNPDVDDDSFSAAVHAYIYLAGRAPANLVPHLLAAAHDMPNSYDRAQLVRTLALQ